MNLQKRIESLERVANVTGHHIHTVRVPYVADDAGQAEAQRPALDQNPAPKETKLTVCLVDYANMEL